jgi:predicted nucleic acid-binding protein
MAAEIFVDTSGFYALLVKKDDRHDAARRHIADAQRKRRPFITTDYVLDETATLLKARGHGHLIAPFFDTVLSSKACRIEWTDATRFDEVRRFFVKHADQSWSFTDCLSFHVMRELRLRDALTKDGHFQEARFTVLLR